MLLAAILALVGTPTSAKRRLAAVFFMSALGGAFALTGQNMLPTASLETNQYLLTAVAGYPILNLLLAAFLLAYPTPARGRAAWPAALAVVLSVIATLFWVFDRPAMLTGFTSTAQRTLLWRTTMGEGFTAVLLLAFASALWRARALAASERRGALLMLTGLGLTGGLVDPGGLGASALLHATGAVEGVYQNALGLVPGDCCRIAAVFWIVARVVIAPGLVLAFWWRERCIWPALLNALQFALVLLILLTGITLIFDATALGIPLAFVAVMRYGAFGREILPRGATLAAAMGVGVHTFFLVASQPLVTAPDFPFAAPLAVLLGLVVGGLVASWTLPPGQGLPVLLGHPPEPASVAERRLEPYTIALERELAGGAAPEEAFERLRALRASLRVSDQEHAVLAYARKRRTEGGANGGSDGDLRPGSRFLDRYRVTGVLREGGMGVTRLCRDERMDRDVVIKSLRSRDASAEGVEAVLREARALGKVRHPAIVAVHDVERVGDEAFIIMEHLEGGSLEDRLKAGPLGGSEFRKVALGLLDALGAVHDAGLIHRDVKPSNVLLTKAGEAKLADFGVAHIPGYETTAAALDSSAVGTIRYMSPEQARGRGVTARSDLFSAGATLFEAWTGEPYLKPRNGESAVELQLRAASPEPFRRAMHGPRSLRAWFARALDPTPGRRFASAAEMRDSLQRVLDA